MTDAGREAPEDGRLDVVISALWPDLSRARARKLAEAGAVRVDGVLVCKAAQKIRRGQVVVVDVPPPVPAAAQPQDLPIAIVHEDDAIVVVDKAPGMVVHPAPGHTDGTLVNALLHHVDGLSGIGGVQRPGIVHRLDRGTSGLLVVAKHDQAHQALAAQFADHSAGRTYLAIVHGEVPWTRRTIESTLARHPKHRVRMASTEGEGRRAVTHARCLQHTRGVSVVACELETGRTHQIRVHLTEQGCPLVGDPLYRTKKSRLSRWMESVVPDQRTMLHAWRLKLTHPTTGERCVFVADVPDDMAAFGAAAGIVWPDAGSLDVRG